MPFRRRNRPTVQMSALAIKNKNFLIVSRHVIRLHTFLYAAFLIQLKNAILPSVSQ